MLRSIAGLVITGSLLVLSGCAEPPPPPSFKKDIEAAEGSIQSGDMRLKMGSYDEAIGQYKQAAETIRKARVEAMGNELSRLKTLDDDVRRKIRDTELKKQLAPTVAVNKPVIAVGEDLAAKAQREEAAAKKKADAATAAEKAKTEALLKADAPKAAKAKGEDEEPDATAVKPAAKGGDAAAVEGGADGVPADAKIIISKAIGPFPTVTDKSPDIEIPKMEIRGNYIIAYVQVFNKSENGVRFDTMPGVFFKDGNGNPIVQPQSVICFQYAGFKPDAKDPTEQTAPGITAGSVAIDGQSAYQFAAVGMSTSAANCKSVTVSVLMSGKKFFANGPSKPAEGGAPKEAPGGVNFK